MDVQGDRVVVLGNPDDWGNAMDATVWLGRLTGEGFEDFEPVMREEEAAADLGERMRMSDYIHALAGSVRFLPDGGLFVFPGYRPTAYLLSNMGDVEQTWDLTEVGVTGAESERLLRGAEGGHPRRRVKEWAVGARVIVDEVMVLGKQPALVIRDNAKGKLRWRLAVLTSPDIEWYRIPVSGDSHSRVRGDSNEHREIVVLLGDRGFGIHEEDVEGQEIRICRLPIHQSHEERRANESQESTDGDVPRR